MPGGWKKERGKLILGRTVTISVSGCELRVEVGGGGEEGRILVWRDFDLEIVR